MLLFTCEINFYKLIQNEIKNAKAKKTALIQLKLNSLTDEELIKKLYAASNAGVKIQLIIEEFAL